MTAKRKRFWKRPRAGLDPIRTSKLRRYQRSRSKGNDRELWRGLYSAITRWVRVGAMYSNQKTSEPRDPARRELTVAPRGGLLKAPGRRGEGERDGQGQNQSLFRQGLRGYGRRNDLRHGLCGYQDGLVPRNGGERTDAARGRRA